MNLTEKTMEQKKKFEQFEKILLKYKDDKSYWRCDLFSHINEEKNSLDTVGGSFSLKMFDYLPFEGNAHLVGTSDMPDEWVELKEGEFVMVCNEPKEYASEWKLREFMYPKEGEIMIQSARFAYGDVTGYKYCIPFSKFNPNDMEETRKHILCAKNGKLVKAIV